MTARGNAGQEIFVDDEDRHAFLEILGDAVERFGWICYAYCLMSNHYHLLVETPNANLSRVSGGQILSFDVHRAMLVSWLDRYGLNTKALSIT